jgi:alkylmercury lyase
MATRLDKQGRAAATLYEIAAAISAALPALDLTDRQISTQIHRHMSSGEPVDPAVVANAVGVPVDRVEEKLNSWPGVFRDDQGRVVGFGGQAIAKLDPEYRFLSEGKTSYAWCALDTLFIPPILGKTVSVEASDPVSGEAVSLVVDGGGARDVRPAGALVSMVVPEGPFDYDVIDTFCHRVLFFASEQTGARWVAENPGTMLLSVPEAFELGRVLTERTASDPSGPQPEVPS